jgi:hypothetical protein
MKRLMSLLLSRNLRFSLGLMVGVLAAITLFSSGHAAADCGITTGDIHDYAGLTVTSKWVGDDGNTNISSNNTVTVSEHNGTGASDDIGGNIVIMSAVQNYYVPGARFTSQTFSQIGGCGPSMVVLPGDGTNGSPSTESGVSDWGLDCDNSKLGTNGAGQPLFQQFDITGNGVPNGARAGGYWGYTMNSSTPAVTAASGAGAAANGNTLNVTIWYTQPPPNNPPTPQPTPTTTGVTCSEITYDNGTVVVGTRSYDIQADIYLSGATLYGGTSFHVNDNFPMDGDHTVNLIPDAQSITMSVVEFYDQGGSIHYVLGSYDASGPHPVAISSAGPCYSASCTMSIDSGLPDNDVVPGRPFTVYASITDTSVPYDGTNTPIPLLPTANGGPSGQLQFQNADGGYSSFSPVAFPSGIANNTPQNISFTATVNGAGTMVGGLAYAGNFFVGSCPAPINLYQPPVVPYAGVACQSNISGAAYDPYIPGFPIYVDIYADGPAGGGGTFIGETQSSGPGNTFSLSMPASYQDGQNHSFYIYGIDPWGVENSAPYVVNMTGCEEFHIVPASNGAALLKQTPTGYEDTDEDPNFFGSTSGDVSETVTYNGNSYYGPNASFDPGFPGVPVASAPYTYTKNGAVVASGQIPSPNGSGRFLDQNWAAPLIPVTVTTTSAGDVYCLDAGVIPTDGIIQNDGTILTDSGGPATSQSCETVQNKPYFKVYGSGVFTGGSFQSVTSSCTGGGELGGWNNNDTGTYPASGDYGSSSQFSAVALDNIVGFASAQTPNFQRLPTDLSFANTISGDISQDTYNPNLGGHFGSTQCLTTETAQANATALPSTSVGALASGSYTTSPGAAGITLNAGQIGLGKNVSIFVNGNVYITGAPGSGITYQDSTGGWTINSDGTSDVPSFTLVVTGGSIYIDPNITELDGLYIAQPVPATPTTDGIIYTCAPGIGPISAGFQANMYNTCKNQLTVYGDFVADQVKLMRTLGSLRDETPTPATGGAPATPPSTPPNPRPVPLYNYQCSTSLGALYYTEGSGGNTNAGSGTANCLPGDTSNGYFYNYPGTFYDTPCQETANPSAYVYVQPAQSCPTGSATPAASAGNPAKPANETSCSNGIGALRNLSLVPITCAAEVFDFSPELYLSSPAVAPTNNGGVQPTAITSLPPVL